MKRFFVFFVVIVVLIPLCWVLVHKFEGTKPVVDVKLPSLYLKKDYKISVNISDNSSGLQRVAISIMQQGKEKILLEKQYHNSSFLGLFPDPDDFRDCFVIPVQFWKYSMKDGPAVIKIMVSDNSWRGWGKGNITYIEKKVIIDSKPPKVIVLSRRHNISRGGSALVIYRLFEQNIKSGVKVGNNFFPGHSGLFKDKNIYAAFFALTDMQGPATSIFVVAEDKAGNITKRGFHHYIRDKNFRTDVLNISDRFLRRKMPDFDLGSENSRFQGKKNRLSGSRGIFSCRSNIKGMAGWS
jgi:hypothetical protein